MRLSILTYNVLFNNALDALESVLNEHQPDIVCLQEVKTTEKNLKKMEFFSYRLADYSHSFIRSGTIFGLATFYNAKRLSFLQSKYLKLSQSLSENIFALLRLIKKSSVERTLLHTNFSLDSSRKKISVCNIHLSLYATNAERIRQLKSILTSSRRYRGPFVVTGDFNYYPYGRKNLDKLMKSYQFDEATCNLRYTFTISKKMDTYNVIQRFGAKLLNFAFIKKFFSDNFKVDYMFYKHLRLVTTKRIEIRHSDHYPILAIFEV